VPLAIAALLLAAAGLAGCASLSGALGEAALPAAAAQTTAAPATRPSEAADTSPFTASEPRSISIPEVIIPTDPAPTGPPSLAATPISTYAPSGTLLAAPNRPRSILTSDLLFVTSGRLVRWDPRTRYGVVLAENVVQFSASQSGKTVALLRRKGLAANGSELFDLELLDFETKQVRPVLRLKPDLADLALSPDGRWLAYRTPRGGGKVYLLPVDDPEAAFQPGECLAPEGDSPASLDCSALFWSPNSKSLLWTDRRGVWLVQSLREPAENLNPGLVELSDPKGKPVQVQAEFSEPRWSPQGRFVLVRVAPRQSEVSWSSVLDTKTGNLVQVIDSFEKQESDSSLAWLEDGRFVVAHASQPGQNRPAEVQLWSVVPTSVELLLPGVKFQFALDALLEKLALNELQNDSSRSICLEWVQPSLSENLGLGVRIIPLDQPAILFELQGQKGDLTPLAELPSDTRQVRWAPDGSGVLLVSQERWLTYLDLETLEMIDLGGALASPRDAAWLPPVIRK
ncbi:MAG: PD40 domain-containing protein, partial [Anaerolineales bacterium]|nr:PD40 domain-containing protein [Anaerolineales bacterium]